jgi:hypothetical protein
VTEQSEALRRAEWRVILRLSAQRRAAREERRRERELDEQFRYEVSRLVLPSARDRYCEERGITEPGF